MPPRAVNVMDPSEWMKPKQQRPVRRSLYAALRKEANVKCLILTGLIYGCIVAIVWCRVTRVKKVDIDFTAFPITSTREISPCDDGSIYIPTAFVVMLYLLYLVECWHCKAWHQLKFEKTDLNSAYQKIHEVRQAQPVVWWKAVCYHYVRRTREITRYRNGNAYTCTQVYYERVNSHVAAGCFFFALCGMKDVSRELIDLEKHAATKIQLSKGFLFANLATAREFQEQRAAFFQEQERYDDYMEMREGMDLSNVHFKESLISWTSPDNPPWFAKIPVFWLCNLLLLSWPLRLILERNTAHLHYQVNKLFGVNYMSPTGSEMLLSAPRSHGLPVNNHQHRINNRAISSHHSRLNGHHQPNNNHRQRSLLSTDVDHDETAPLLNAASNSSQRQGNPHLPGELVATEQHEPNQYFNNNSPQYMKSEKDSESELHGGSSKTLHKDQHSSNNNSNNNVNNNSTNNNNNNITSSSTTTPLLPTNANSPSSSSGRLYFPWKSSFFSRNFRFARQSGYKLTRSVTLLMTKPERLQFLASTTNQHQFPDEFGYYGDSDEGARLLHDEAYYPSCSSPPPPPFLTPSPEEEDEDVEQRDNEQCSGGDNRSASRANNGNGNDRNRSGLPPPPPNNPRHRHYHRHQHPLELHHHRTSLVLAEEDVNSSTNCLAPSYSQALLLMEPNERNSVVAYWNEVSSTTLPTTSTNSSPPSTESSVPPSLPPPPSLLPSHATVKRCNSSGTAVVGLGTANLTNEHTNPTGFMNVTGIDNDRGSADRRGCTSTTTTTTTTEENHGAPVDEDIETFNLSSAESTEEQQSGHHEQEEGGSNGAPAAHYLQENGSLHNNCPVGTTTDTATLPESSSSAPSCENPSSLLSGNEPTRAATSHHSLPPSSQVIQQEQNGHHNYLGNQPGEYDGGGENQDDLSVTQEGGDLFSKNNQQPTTAVQPTVRRQDQPGSSTSLTNNGHQPHHYHRSSSARLPSSGSSMVLNSVAPREMTGVQIDLTQPIVVTVPRDPLRESAALGALAAGNSSSSSSTTTASSAHRHQYYLKGDPNAHFSRNDEPPTYVEALRTSRPVFLPTLARIRRCFTERDIASRFSSNRSLWLDEIADVEGGFVQTGNITNINPNVPVASTGVSNHHHYGGHGGVGRPQPSGIVGDRGSGVSSFRAAGSSTSRV